MNESEQTRWRIIASSHVIDTRFLRLRKDTIELPAGELIEDYYVRESRGFVVIFALTPDDRVVLVRQYKHGIGRELLELPAGAIDPGEEPWETAERELREETGYTAQTMELVRSFVVDPTNSDSIAHLYLARGARETDRQDLDVTENIRIELAGLEQLHVLVRDGTIDSVAHVASVYLLFDLFGLRG